MAMYFVQYELRSAQEYDSFYKQLAEFDAVQLLETLWCFRKISTGAAGLREILKQFIDANDKLVVSEVSNWATFNTIGNPNDR